MMKDGDLMVDGIQGGIHDLVLRSLLGTLKHYFLTISHVLSTNFLALEQPQNMM